MGACTTSLIKRETAGSSRQNTVDITLSSSYATGGDSCSAAQLGMTSLDSVSFDDMSAGGYQLKYDLTNNTVLAYLAAGATPSGTVAVTMTDGSRIASYAPGGGDIKGSANTDVAISGGSLPTNGGLISNLASADATTAFTIALQPDVPRNVSVSYKNIKAGASTGNAVDVVIVGTHRGAAQTETISFSGAELTSGSQNEVATKYGSKPFTTLTSITPSAGQPAGEWQHAAGPGSKLALPTDLDTPAEADVLKITKNAANLSPSGIVSTTNATVNLGALADGDDVGIWYKEDYDGAAGTATFTGAAGSAASLTEVTASTNLSTTTARAIVRGR